MACSRPLLKEFQLPFIGTSCDICLGPQGINDPLYVPDVDICENALSYDGMLAAGAVTEICGLLRPGAETILENLQKLQKRLKYGLPSFAAIA